jgi:hypothetical protein
VKSLPLIAFEFDIGHAAVATISNDSSVFGISVNKDLSVSPSIRGDDPPITFVDGGVIIGRKQGTIFQLLPNKSNTVLSTIKLVHGFADDPVCSAMQITTRIQSTVGVAINRHDSVIAFKLGFEASSP